MHPLIRKHKPANTTDAQWEERWEAAGDLLEPLAKALKDMQLGMGSVKGDDFDTPNHYAKLVFELTRAQTISKVMELLPKSVV